MAADVFDRLTHFVIFIGFCFVICEEKPILFSKSDDVIILSGDTFNSQIHDTTSFWLVNFYNSWCGHCVVFAPTWNKFAKDIRGWQPLVKIGVMDCSEENSIKTCREHNIDGYPSLLYFPPHATYKNRGDIYNDTRTMDLMRHGLLQYMEGRHTYKPIDPLRSLEHIWEFASTTVEYVAVFFEDESSYIGRELILDMSPYKNLLLRRMLRADVTQYGIKIFPSLYLIKQDGTFHNLASTGTDREHFRSALKQLVNVPEDARTNTSHTVDELSDAIEDDAGVGQDTNSVIKHPGMSSGVYLEDILSAITYSMTHEIAGTRTIEGDALHALYNYIDILYQYLPLQQDVRNYLKKVRHWLQDISTSLHGETWLNELKKFQDTSSYIPSSPRYYGCRGSDAGYRGYPCSIWVLFHTLTVNAALQHETDTDYDSQEVLLVMRAYITHFFGCRECSEHFNQGARFIEDKVKHIDDSILLLWTMHNRANFFLKNTPTEDPQYPKIQFPPKGLCPECYINDTLINGKPNWDEVSVLKFLKKFYSNVKDTPAIYEKDNEEKFPIKDDKISQIVAWRKNDAKRRDDLAKLPDIKAGKNINDIIVEEPKYNEEKIKKLRQVEFDTRISGKAVVRTEFFSGLDLSMCVVFYVVCTALIIMAYFHFIVRRRMKPTMLCCKELV